MDIEMKNLIDEKLIFVIDEEISKDNLINYLIDESEKYLEIGTLLSLRESIFKKEDASPNMTAIGNSLAIPHGIFFDYSYTKDIFITIAKVENGVKDYESFFDDKKVKYIFLIAYNQECYCTKRTAVMPLVAQFFTNERNIAKLEDCKTSSEIYKLLLEH